MAGRAGRATKMLLTEQRASVSPAGAGTGLQFQGLGDK